MAHENSRLAYAQIADSLSQSRRAVYEMIARHGLVTRQEISDFLGWEINKVTPRVCELLDKGQIIEAGSESVWTGRRYSRRARLCVNPDYRAAA